jgi:hypothetical protein
MEEQIKTKYGGLDSSVHLEEFYILEYNAV